MPFLTARERRSLESICTTLMPELEPTNEKRAIAEFNPLQKMDLINRLEEAYELAIDENARRELKLLLNAFETAIFNGLLSGQWSAFSTMPQSTREAILFEWANSRLFLRRKAFQGIKRLALFLSYSTPPEGTHPIWADIGYPGSPKNHATVDRPITPLQVKPNTTLTTDVLIIGSGAGGGVVAGELTNAGFQVLVVEKGNYYADHEIDGNELKSTQDMYEKYGALTTQDTALMVLAGSVLGGGTMINWAGSLRPPQNVLEEWARDYGFTGALSADFQHSLDAVSDTLHVNSEECALNANNAQFVKGCEALGYPVDVIPRNVQGCEDCGFCNFGCAFGAKKSTTKTYLQEAHRQGAQILVKASVERVTHANGTVNGAIVTVENADGTRTTLTVKARAVVVSAGSLHTPAVLKRSGLTNPQIGANLHLHPTTVIFSLFDDQIHTWQGAPMTRVTKKFTNLDGKGYGFVLEVAPAHPGLTASTLPWMNAREHKRLVGSMGHLANVICIVRDFHGGTVKLDKQGQPILDYRLHPYDRAHLEKGVLEALKVHHASNAKEVYSPHNAQIGYKRGEGDFEAFLARVEKLGLEPNTFPLFSAHQMSSCRVGGNATQGAVKPNGETYEVRNLFVADASTLPTATGVNPMLTIMGMAHYLAQHIKSSLTA